MSAKHTPGPWRIYSLPTHNPDGENVWMYGMKIKRSGQSSFAEHDANARLIAAAPELLAQLKATTDLLHDLVKDEVDDPAVGITGWTEARRVVADARAAIAKAEGKS